MVPTEDEINLIQDAMQSSTAPLGSAEKFLLTLSSISELEARLSLWSFKVDYDTLEKVSILKFLANKLFIIFNLTCRRSQSHCKT